MAKCSNFSEIKGKVPLKRSFQLTGNENMVPVSESPTYPGSHLSEVFLMKFDKEVHGTQNICPTQQKSHLSGVPLIQSILYIYSISESLHLNTSATFVFNISNRIWGDSSLLFSTVGYLYITTTMDKNNEKNDKFYRKVAFPMYTEMVNFRPQS